MMEGEGGLVWMVGRQWGKNDKGKEKQRGREVGREGGREGGT